MSVEDRLYALVLQCRQQNGDAFLQAPGQLAPRLNSQAPDLHAEIRALASALEGQALTRINTAPDPEAEANAVAAEIAVRERLSMASVTPAVAVARRLGPLAGAGAGAGAPTPAAGGWAGDSLAVSAASPQPAPAPQPAAYVPPPPAASGAPGAPAAPNGGMMAYLKKPWVLGAAAVDGGLLIYQNMNSGPQAPQGQPPEIIGAQPPPNGPQGPGFQGPDGQGPGVQGPGAQQPGGGPVPPPSNQSDSAPLLRLPGQGEPTVRVQQHSSGSPAFLFQLETPRGPSTTMVMLPQGGWENGPVGMAMFTPGQGGNGDIATGGQGRFQLIQSNGAPVRVAQIQMQKDDIGVGGMCIAVMGQSGQQDVTLSGSKFCMMDTPCSRPIGCGTLQ